jgi:hypothetical protein
LTVLYNAESPFIVVSNGRQRTYEEPVGTWWSSFRREVNIFYMVAGTELVYFFTKAPTAHRVEQILEGQFCTVWGFHKEV